MTNITINLSNIGSAPAFNIFLDIFDNETYSNNATLAFLNNNNFIVYNFSISNTSNATLFTAIADFGNLVDESSESNNIANSLAIIKNDLDGDGIDDESDTLIGNISSINTTISNLTVKIGNLTDLSQAFNGTWKISFEDSGVMLMEFYFNLSKVLNLSKIMVERQSNGSFGYTLVNGLALDGTKTMYIDRIDTAVNGVCIKDAEISSISEISDDCSAANEIKIECSGTLQGSYACSFNSTTSKYKVTGLNNSGIKQIDYAEPADSAPAAGGDRGGSGSSSSGSCPEKWQCDEWSECSNNLQTRSCRDASNCGTIFHKPSETELCAINEKSALDSVETGNNYDKKSKNGKKYFLPDITGFLVNPPENASPAIGTFIVFIIIAAGLFGYFYFIYKKP